ncbi:MAG: uracil-DNA glycosylase [Kangiella sp.]|nr:MAG: uracil-DNA glycosylase [Kangiella sp.]
MKIESQIKFKNLLDSVNACTLCENDLPLGVNPVVQLDPQAKILIAGQAPGRIVHETNIPLNDKSGDRLRLWMGIDKELFYDATKIAILPMGFCFPGTGKSGDLPPRKECAEKWRHSILEQLPNIELTLVIGLYAMKWHLGKSMQSNLTNTVKNHLNYSKKVIPLPHPSPRNYGWLKKNPWFEKNNIPLLKKMFLIYFNFLFDKIF